MGGWAGAKGEDGRGGGVHVNRWWRLCSRWRNVQKEGGEMGGGRGGGGAERAG